MASFTDKLKSAFHNVKDWAVAKIKQYSKKKSIEEIKNLLKQKKNLVYKDFYPGTIIFTGYDAKDKTKVFDRTPFIFILKVSFTHTLAINFHWLPMQLRISLIRHIIELNKDRIKKGRQPQFSYQEHKAFLKSKGYMPVVRLYINKRFSKQGVIIPPERFYEIAPISSESFTGVPEYTLYKLAKEKKI